LFLEGDNVFHVFWVCDCILNIFDGCHWILWCNYCFWKVTMYCILNGVCRSVSIKYTLTGTHHSIYNTMSPSKSNNYKIEFSVIHQKHLIYSRTPKNMKYNVTHQKPLNTHWPAHTIQYTIQCHPVTLYCILNGVCLSVCI
jgi:hypothetical protein